MKSAGKSHRQVRSGRRVKGSPPAQRTAPPVLGRHEAFRERLGALDRAVEQAIAESGAGVAGGSWTAEALERALERWAALARAMESGTALSLLDPRAVLRLTANARERDEFGRESSFEAALVPLARALYRWWWRVETGGLERVPREGRALFVANRASGVLPYDGAMLKLALGDVRPEPRAVRPLVDPAILRLPLLGEALARAGWVAARATNAARLLERDQAVLWFPEGTEAAAKLYRDRYRLARFGRGSFVRVALETGAPIVPVAIVGAEEIHPTLARWDRVGRWLGLPTLPFTATFPWLGALGLVPLPSKWRIEFGEPIDLRARYEAEAAGDARLVKGLAAEMRERLSALLSAAVARRGRPFL